VRRLAFEWDPKKARANALKHRVGFEEARSVFFDEHALVVDDPDHGEQEARFVILGESDRRRLLTVVHCYRGTHDVIRIISARRASGRERVHYHERRT
jgi:uncharacterized protein